MLVFFPCMLYIVRFTKVWILFKSRYLKQQNLPYGDRFLLGGNTPKNHQGQEL